MESSETDILVVGAGAAGLCAALHAAPRRVLLLAPEGPDATSTAAAKGGIAAPLGRGDSIALHTADTLIAADHSGSESATAAIVAGAAEAIRFLRHHGLRFDDEGGEPHLHLEAGHSLPRILHADGDRTGAAIQATLWKAARAAAHITIRRDLVAVSLVGDSAGIGGIVAQGLSGENQVIRASQTVLATGGIGQLFAATTNPRHAAGDGLAMALAHGVRVAGLEFVQFHPTALRCHGDPLPLLTEALRGAGARLIADGRQFMHAVDPRGDLAPRDVVARGVWDREHRGQEVMLDATGIFGRGRSGGFPSALAACTAHGIDPALSPIPVTCAAHFHMGGIVIDENGRTSLSGLWAAGEIAYTGLHGANRLASNSLLEAIVIGSAAGAALRTADSGSGGRRLRLTREPATVDPVRAEWSQLRKLMWAAMGPVRSGPALTAALARLRRLGLALDPVHVALRQRIGLAEAMVVAARARRESRGAHWRSDFPSRDRSRDGAGALCIMARP